MRRACSRRSFVAAAVLIAAAGCSGDPSGVDASSQLDREVRFDGLVTNAAAKTALIPDVAYVSLAAGRMPNATSATIENRRTRQSIGVEVVDGGFDPVAIRAQAGDTVVMTFGLAGSATERRWSVVPRARRPVMLRSDAVGHSVQLDANILMVFSEPIDPASLTGSIALRRNGTLVSGTSEVLPLQPWIVRFTPATPLADAAAYELGVTDGVRDLDGETLESPANLTITTVILARPGQGRIAFSAWGPDGAMIYTMNPDGSGLVKVTRGTDPNFSPDGKKLAFWRYEPGGTGAVYVADADGSNVIRLGDGEQPTWSPDGRRLAYGCGSICIIGVDGSGLTRITPPGVGSATGEACVRDTDPAWSPNGTTIAFTRWPDARIPQSMCLSLAVAISFPFDFWTTVYMIEADGSNLRPLRDDAGTILTYAGWPSWSPDGKKLAFYYADADDRIQTANADGSGAITVARGSPVPWADVIGSPAWSPDGRRILVRTSDGWGFADASGGGQVERVLSPFSIVPNSLSWSWSQR